MIITHMPLSMEARLPIYAQLHGLPPKITSPLETVARLVSDDKIDDDLFWNTQSLRYTDANDCVTCCSTQDMYWDETKKRFVNESGILLLEQPLTLILGVYVGHRNPSVFPVYTVPDKNGNAGCILRRTLTFDLILLGESVKDKAEKLYCCFILMQVYRSSLLDVVHEGNCDVVAERIFVQNNPTHYMQLFMSSKTVSGNSPYCNQSEPVCEVPSWSLYPCIDREHTLVEDYIMKKAQCLGEDAVFKSESMQDRTAKNLLDMIDAVCELRVP